MAKILNIETSTTVCSVSISLEGKVVALEEINNGYTHAENLTVFIQEVSEKSGIKLKDLDAISISKGPGSYTGLRIGVSTAKGLCFALDKPLLSINTLTHMALAVKEEIVNKQINITETSGTILLCPMIDARRMEVYTALYDLELNVLQDVSAVILDENSFSDYLKNNIVLFFGDGAAKCSTIFEGNKNAIILSDIVPSAKDMAMFSEESFNKKQFENVAYFEPFYLKDFVSGGQQ